MLIYMQTIESPEEQSKFERIYYSYRHLLYQVAFRILHQEQDAEDVVHDTFLKVIQIIDKIVQPVCPQTQHLIVIIAENKSLDILRKRKKVQFVDFNDAYVEGYTLELPDGSVGKCLNALPTRYRDVLILRHHYGYHLKEIAFILDISEENVKKIHQRAKRSFQIICEKEGLL